MEKRTLSELIEHLFNNVKEMELDPTDKAFILGNLIAIGQKVDEIRRILLGLKKGDEK